jgi:hypothetical protein
LIDELVIDRWYLAIKPTSSCTLYKRYTPVFLSTTIKKRSFYHN